MAKDMNDGADPSLVNALNIDVDDCVASALQSYYRRWENIGYSPSVFRELEYVLDLFLKLGLGATLFFPGWVARARPDLVRRASGEGHEIGSHGYHHRIVSRSTPAEFRKDLRESLLVLRNILGTPVTIFKAPRWSIDENSLWAFDILAEEGIKIDCTARPRVKKRLGYRPDHNLPIRLDNGLFIIPPTSATLFGLYTPLITGGGWCSIADRLGLRAKIIGRFRELNRRGVPFVFYFHPYEIKSFTTRGTAAKFHWEGFLYHLLAAERLGNFFLEVSREFPLATISRAFGRYVG